MKNGVRVIVRHSRKHALKRISKRKVPALGPCVHRQHMSVKVRLFIEEEIAMGRRKSFLAARRIKNSLSYLIRQGRKTSYKGWVAPKSRRELAIAYLFKLRSLHGIIRFVRDHKKRFSYMKKRTSRRHYLKVIPPQLANSCVLAKL